jgi:hypothetical protein
VVLADPKLLEDGSFQFSFTNVPGAVFTALASTALSLSPANWTILGNPVEIASGRFQFTDSGATNALQHFYRVRSP